MINTPFVGRSREIQQLTDILMQVMHGKPALVFLSGEAGVGKSRIIQEFIELSKSIYPNIVTAIGECNCYYGHADPLLPFRTISTQLFDENPKKSKYNRSHNIAKKAAKIILEIAPDTLGIFIPLAGIGLKLLHILGKTTLSKSSDRINDSLFARIAIFEQYSRLLFWISDESPLLLILEDLHWSDTATLDFLFYFVRSWKNQKIMIIGTYRPSDIDIDEKHHFKQIRQEMIRYKLCYHIDIDWLNQEDIKEWLTNAYNPNKFSEEFIQLIYQHTEGNALFVDEILKFLQENNLLFKDSDGIWNASIDIHDIHTLPETIVAVLEQRLSKLEATMRELLTCASVEGEEFTAQVIAAIRHLEEYEVLTTLENIFDQKLKLISLKEEKLLTSQKWLTVFQFRHTLMQNYLYNTLSKPQRRRLHQLVGNYLEEFYKEDISIIAPALARHFAEAKDESKFIKYALLAAKNAENAYDYKIAKTWLEMLKEHFDVIKSNNLIAAEILHYLGRIQIKIDKLSEAEVSFMKALKYLDNVEYNAIISQILIDLAYLYTMTDRSEQAANLLEKIINSTSEITIQLGYAYLNLANAYQKMTRHDLHFKYLMQAKNIFDNVNYDAGLADTYRALGIYYKIMNDFDQSVKHLESSIAIHQRLGDKYGQALDYNNLGSTYLVVGNNADKALICYQKAIKLCKDIYAVHEEAHILLNIGRLYGLKQDLSQAADYVEKGLELSIKVGKVYNIIRSKWYLGIIYYFQGFSDKAINIYNDALRFGINDPWLLWPILCNLGTIEMMNKNFDKALTAYEKACSTLIDIMNKMPKTEQKQFLLIHNRINVFHLLKITAKYLENNHIFDNIQKQIPQDLIITESVQYLPKFYWGGGIWV